MLIEGIKPRDVSAQLNVDYKLVNGILSNNTWKHVIVEGWDNYRNTRPKVNRMSEDEMLEVYNKYLTGQFTQLELAEMYGKTRATIYRIIKKFK